MQRLARAFRRFKAGFRDLGRFPLALSLVLVVLGTARADRVTFRVAAPADTPEKAPLFLAGNLPQLGNWNAAGVQLNRQDDGKWSATLDLPAGAEIEFKITRGNWETVEKGADGQEIDNRKHTVNGDATIDVVVARFAAGAPALPKDLSTRSGDLRVHEKFPSKALGNERRLWVWLPAGYEQNAETRYPVLYLQDGQNLFDNATSFAGEWRADETAGRLLADGKIRPVILVGIDNAGVERLNEYGPTKDATINAGGKAADYARFVLEEVKPFIDRTYRTAPEREQTGLGGSSMGGLVSLFIVREHNDTFGLVAALSPTLGWDDANLLKSFAGGDAWIKRTRIWADVGDAEGDDMERVRAVSNLNLLSAMLKQSGRAEGRDYVARVVEGAGHNESAWAARFEDVLRFLYPPEAKPSAPKPERRR